MTWLSSTFGARIQNTRTPRNKHKILLAKVVGVARPSLPQNSQATVAPTRGERWAPSALPPSQSKANGSGNPCCDLNHIYQCRASATSKVKLRLPDDNFTPTCINLWVGAGFVWPTDM
jgi:hypothetical protein